MIDSGEKTVSIRVYESTRDQLEEKKKTFGPKMKDWPDYKDLIKPAVDLYLAKSGTDATKGLQGNHQPSQQDHLLLQPLPGVNLTGKKLALYRELASKVAEVIAEGNSALVGILTQGIQWAYRDLRPSTTLKGEPPGEHVPVPKSRAGAGRPK